MNFSNENNPEIHLHKDLMKYFDEQDVKYKAYGSAGPDFIFLEFDCIGEVKKKESVRYVKEALKEAFERKGQYSIDKYSFLFVATPKFVRIFNVEGVSEWESIDLDSAIKFEIAEINLFIIFLKNNCSKIEISNHLEYVLNLLLSEEFDISIQEILNIILHLNDPYVFVKDGIFFNPESNSEFFIQIKSKKTREFVKNFLAKFKIKDIEIVKEYIKHNYSSHLPDNKKSNLGKYYTPKEIVEIMKEIVMPYITPSTYLLDMACGCGAFLDLFDDCKIIGRDIDPQAVEVLKLFKFYNVEVDNSLINVNRSKYGLNMEDKLIIIGNPPYNDTTSKNKRFGTNKKTKVDILTDNDVKSKDFGISFLKAYSKLNPEYVCVLHPLSYLIKKANFDQLAHFKENYILGRGIIFSSRLFKDLKDKTEFPVIIAFYKKGNMNYDYVKSFQFDILNSDEKFSLNQFETIDDNKFIRKYPTKDPLNKEKILTSDINLYMYNIRDTNSLIAGGNIMCDKSHDVNYVTVQFEDLYKYAYLNCYKHFFPNNYMYGNLSPLVRQEELENDEYLKDLFIIGLILKNQRLSVLNIANNESIIYEKFLINEYRMKSKSCTESTNIYQCFLDFVENQDTKSVQLIYKELELYFKSLLMG